MLHAQQIQDDDLVVPPLEPHSRHVQGALGTDAPNTAERLAVEPDEALVPTRCVEKGIRSGGAERGRAEIAAIETRRGGARFAAVMKPGGIRQPQRIDLPVVQRRSSQCHRASDALALLAQLEAVVASSRVLDQHIQAVILANLQWKLRLYQPPIQAP